MEQSQRMSRSRNSSSKSLRQSKEFKISFSKKKLLKIFANT